jgi:hypothetical protein
MSNSNRVAILISGAYRTFDKTWPNNEKILEKLAYEYDIFFILGITIIIQKNLIVLMTIYILVWVTSRVGNTDKQTSYNFKTKITFEEGIKECINYFCNLKTK